MSRQPAALARLRRVTAATVADALAHARRQGMPPTCRGSGCSGCCRGWIVTLPSEVAEIAPRVSADAWARLGDTDPRNEKAPCPLLDERGGCTVYPVRPTHCRIHFVASPPAYCGPEAGPGDDLRRLVSPAAEEALLSAVHHAYGVPATAADAWDHTFRATLVYQLQALRSTR